MHIKSKKWLNYQLTINIFALENAVEASFLILIDVYYSKIFAKFKQKVGK